MKTIANYLMLACITVVLSACASSGTKPASVQPAKEEKTVHVVPPELQESVDNNKKEGLNGSFVSGNFYLHDIKLSDVDLIKYGNGLHMLDLEYRENGNIVPVKMKFYQRNYTIASVLYSANAQRWSDMYDMMFTGYSTPKAYFDTTSANYTYKGVALTATDNGQFTYHLSINLGKATGHGTVTGITELGLITLDTTELFEKDGTLLAVGAANFTNGSSVSYAVAMSGPNAEEAVGAIAIPREGSTNTFDTIILSGER